MVYSNHPIQTLKVGALETHKTLGVAKSQDVGYFFASTSEMSGDSEANP